MSKIKTTHYQFSDREFESQFEQAIFDAKLFNHEAHLRLAWIHIRKYGVEKAVENITMQLKNYTEELGVKEKYHETVTVAAIRAVNHFIAKPSDDCLKGFISEHRRLKTNFKDLLDQHYRTDPFASDKARKEYMEPDLLPF